MSANGNPRLKSGADVGHYRIEDEIGRGGMAIVYRAHDSRHDRTVALKALHPDIAAALGTERFLREIRLAARLNHPHIVPLHDSGEFEGLLYYVMPFIEGRTLRARIEEQGQIAIEEALRLAVQVASALDYAHRLGVVHRDIKPENVMLHEGVALVTDFGIARALSSAGASTLTQTGIALGTPAYMSPEQAVGETDLDGRSDQYSLACVIYEMLTGEPPFVADTAQALVARRFTHKPQSLRRTVPNISDTVAGAVSRALALEPSDRFPTAAEFGAALARKSAEPPRVEKRSIAVLPFANMSADTENEFFSDGVTEEIINALSKVQALEVVSRRSAFAYKGKNLDMREIGRQLGVRNLLEGSVRRAAKRLRVTAELIDVETGYHLWSERFDRDMADIFDVQDEIASNIVKALRVVLTDREETAIKAARTRNIRAYEYYLRGRQLFHTFRNESFEAAQESFRRAIALDPDYALAYTGLADVSMFRHLYFRGEQEELEQAEAASRRAVELDPTLAEAHAARGLVLSSGERLQEAEAALLRAIELDPTLFEAPYYYGRLLHIQGHAERAARQYEIAAALREDDYQANALAHGLYASLGMTADLMRVATRGLAATERALRSDPGDTRALYLGASLLQAVGRTAEATDWANRAVDLDPNDQGMLYNLACFHSVAGRKQQAMELLERAAAAGWNRSAWARRDTDLDPLRGEPRFERLLERMEAADEAG